MSKSNPNAVRRVTGPGKKLHTTTFVAKKRLTTVEKVKNRMRRKFLVEQQLEDAMELDGEYAQGS